MKSGGDIRKRDLGARGIGKLLEGRYLANRRVLLAMIMGEGDLYLKVRGVFFNWDYSAVDDF
jgi:hypothetical protein